MHGGHSNVDMYIEEGNETRKSWANIGIVVNRVP